MKGSPKIIITELFLIKADWERTFWGEITREIQDDGSEIVRGKAIINEGFAWSTGKNQAELAKNLDDVCILKLDNNLHGSDGKYISLGLTTAIIPYGDEADKLFLN